MMFRGTLWKLQASGCSAAVAAVASPLDDLVSLCAENNTAPWPKDVFTKALESQVYQREVDTLFSCVRYGAPRGLMNPPTTIAPSSESSNAEGSAGEVGAKDATAATPPSCNIEWKSLIEASQYHGIESRAVLSGRNVTFRQNATLGSRFKESAAASLSGTKASVPSSIMYGVVPLSERRRISDGSGLLSVLEAMVTSLEVRAAQEAAGEEQQSGGVAAAFTEAITVSVFSTLHKLAATLDAQVLGKIAGVLMRHVGDGNEETMHPLIAEKVATLVKKCIATQIALKQKLEKENAALNAVAIEELQENIRLLGVSSVREGLRCAVDNVASPASSIIEFLKVIIAHHHTSSANTVDNAALRVLVEDAAGVVGEDEDGKIVGNVAVLRCHRLSEDVTATAFVELYESTIETYGKLVEFSLELVRWLVLDPANLMDSVAELKSAVADLAAVSTTGNPTHVELSDVHKVVIKALCENYVPPSAATSPVEGEEDSTNTDAQYYVDIAYQMVLSHKYHGLNVTADMIKPLTAALSTMGDSRIFNLVDICTLFCENTIDMEVLDHLFNACYVNGDHHRAKTMYGLLRDDVSGLLSKLTPSTVENLKKLRVLPVESPHIFSDPFKPFDFDSAPKTVSRKR